MPTVTIFPEVDLYIQGGSSARQNFASELRLIIKKSDPDFTRRILLAFNASEVPQDAPVSGARLRLTQFDAGAVPPRPLEARPVSRWFTAAATWEEAVPGEPWATPGGDMQAAVARKDVPATVGITVEWDVTAFVQQIVAGANRKVRLALVDAGGPEADTHREFGSTRTQDPAKRPQLVVTYGDGPPDLRVAQWNIHKGIGTDDVTDDDRTADALVTLRADVIGMNEVHFFKATHANVNQGRLLARLMRERTGEPWTAASMVNGTDYGQRRGVGNVLLTPLPVVSNTSYPLPNERAIAGLRLRVGGRDVHLFSTHVEFFNSAWRTDQTTRVRDWTGGFDEPRIVMGDFNTNPGTGDYEIMANVYRDSWVEARGLGRATGYRPNGNTHGGSRFDYVYLAGPLEIVSCDVPDLRIDGIAPSDHDPVVVTMRVS